MEAHLQGSPEQDGYLTRAWVPTIFSSNLKLPQLVEVLLVAVCQWCEIAGAQEDASPSLARKASFLKQSC